MDNGFLTKVQKQCSRESIGFQQMVLDNWISSGKKWTLSHTLYHVPKLSQRDIRPKWKKTKTMKFLEENIGENLCDFGLGQYFLGTKLKV